MCTEAPNSRTNPEPISSPPRTRTGRPPARSAALSAFAPRPPRARSCFKVHEPTTRAAQPARPSNLGSRRTSEAASIVPPAERVASWAERVGECKVRVCSHNSRGWRELGEGQLANVEFSLRGTHSYSLTETRGWDIKKRTVAVPRWGLFWPARNTVIWCAPLSSLPPWGRKKRGAH